MKNFPYFIFLLFLLGACSTLTTSQIAAVNEFGKTTEEFSAYPAKIMTELADIRLTRGLYFASTLEDPQLHITELDSIFSQKEYDYAVSQRIDVTFRIIDKYARSLVLLSSEEPIESTEKYAAGFGTGLDSLVTLYNSLDHTAQLPTGIGNVLNQLLYSGSRQYIKSKQAKNIKRFVVEADSLVAVMTTNLLDYLQSSTIEELIAHEERMIRRDYLTYLQQTETNTFNSQKDYLNLKDKVKNTKLLQEQTIEATKELRETHRKLLQVIQQKHKIGETIKELQDFQQHVLAIRNTIKEIESINE